MIFLEIILPVLLFLALIWCAILSVSARFTGWQQLSKFYPAAAPIDGPRWRFQSATLGNWANYSGCLNVAVNTDGIHVLLFPLFRIGHPALFLPWSDLTTTRVCGWFGVEYIRFDLAKVPAVPIQIEERLAKKMAEAIGNSLPENRAQSAGR